AARRRTSDEQVVSREKSERIATANVTDTAAIPVTEDMSDGPLTRRQLRELERRRRAQDPRHEFGGPIAASGGGIGSSVVPGVSNPERFRALRHVEQVEVPDDSRFAPGEDDLRRTAQPLDREESLAVARGAAGAGVVPDALAAVEARIAGDRASAGSSSGAAVVPDALAAVRARVAGERASAGAASGAAIVPPRTNGATAEQPGAISNVTTPAKVTWRDLWGFRRDSEEQ
nr:hypothetical protein [Actinomycetales bacterium]